MDNLKTFFKDNFDGAEAYVSSGGVHVEGTVEQRCKLVFQEHYGLRCLTKLEYNNQTKEVIESIRKKTFEVREKESISYAVAGDLYNQLSDIIKNTYIQAGLVYYHGVVKVNSTYENNLVRDCEITYKDGSIVKIRAIKFEKQK